MFVEMPSLELLVYFTLFGFAVSTVVVVKYSWKLGGWLTEKLANKLSSERK